MVHKTLKDQDERALWEELFTNSIMQDTSHFPLIKILDIGVDSGEFQFKHLSFQEALFCESLAMSDVTAVDAFWESDEVAVRNMNNPFYRNTFSIGSGHIGEGLARVRPIWDFSEHELNDLGRQAMNLTIHNAKSLVRLVLAVPALPRSSRSSSEPVGHFMTPTLPSSLALAFRRGRLTGSWQHVDASIYVRRHVIENTTRAEPVPDVWTLMTQNREEQGDEQCFSLPER